MSKSEQNELKGAIMGHINKSRFHMRVLFVVNMAIVAIISGTLYSTVGGAMTALFVLVTIFSILMYGFLSFRFGTRTGNIEGIELMMKTMSPTTVRQTVEDELVEKCMASFKEEHGLETDDEAFELIEKMLANTDSPVEEGVKGD